MSGGCDLSSCNICSTALLSVLSFPLPESSRLPQCQAQGGAPRGLSNKPLCDWADPQPTLPHCPSALYFGLHLHLLPATNLLSTCWLTKCHHKQIVVVILINITFDGTWLIWGNAEKTQRAGGLPHLPPPPLTAWRGHMAASGPWASWRTRRW